MIVELNADGYPTERTLRSISEAPFEAICDLDGFMAAIAPLFRKYGRCERLDDGRWAVWTGGWSGCEDVILALRENSVFWGMYWLLSRRGGYYEFGS